MGHWRFSHRNIGISIAMDIFNLNNMFRIVLKTGIFVGKLAIIQITPNCIRKIFGIFFFLDFFIDLINNVMVRISGYSNCFENSYFSTFGKLTDSICSEDHSCQVTYFNFTKNVLHHKNCP